ncbi:MAG: hypothetical protein HIU57_05370 [Acidobacteria bacterium]|nr:hypothetical protein [Acidobacteriota bacterium]
MKLRSRPLVAILLVGSSLALSACGTQSAGTALTNWAKSSNLTTNSAQLVSVARHALLALKDPRTTAAQLHTVCAVLDVEALQAYAALPTPDAQTTQLLTAVYTDLGDGANECYLAAHSTSKRDRASAYLRRAGAELSEAQARVSALRSS